MMLVSSRGRVLRAATALAAAIALAGCGDDDSVSPNAPAACTGAVTVTVSGGTTPQFSWMPACAMVALVVEEGADDQWTIVANQDSGFGPSVLYGTKPAGTAQSAPATPLRAGVPYNVTLFYGPVAKPVVSTTRSFTP